MSISYIHHQSSRRAVRRSGWRAGAFQGLGPRAAPRASLRLLTARVTAGRGPPPRWPGRGPPLRRGLRRVVRVKVSEPPRGTVLDRATRSALEQTTRPPPTPPCHLRAPRPLLGGTRPDRLMGRSAHARPPRRPPGPCLGTPGPLAPRRPAAAPLQAPGGRQVRDAPGSAGPVGAVPDGVGQRRGAGLTGACRSTRPPPRAGRPDTGRPAAPSPRAAGRGLPWRWGARWGWRRGRWARAPRPARRLGAPADQASRRGAAAGVARPVAARPGQRRPLAPGHPPRRCARRGGAGAPAGGTAPRLAPGAVPAAPRHRSPAPPRRRPVGGGRGTRRACANGETLSGGPSAAAALGAAPPARRRAWAPDTGGARGRPAGGARAWQRPPGEAAGRLERRHVT